MNITKFRNEKRIFITGSTYTLMLYLLLVDDYSETIFVFNGYGVDKSIIRKLSTECITYTRQNNSNYSNLFHKIKNHIYEKKRYSEFLRKFSLEEYNVWGHDHIFSLAYPFITKFDVIIEDGMINYQKYNLIKKRFGKQMIFSLIGNGVINPLKLKYKFFGFDNRVKSIILTGIKELPEDLKYKSKIINIYDLWKEKNQKKRDKILSIFGGDNLKNLIENNKENEKTILLTQPLSEDNLCSESEKIDFYHQIVDRYEKNTIIIKPHPRELTEYSNIFKDVLIMDKKVPFELIMFAVPNIKKVVTFFSTSLYHVPESIEIEKVSWESNERIKKLYGNV